MDDKTTDSSTARTEELIKLLQNMCAIRRNRLELMRLRRAVDEQILTLTQDMIL